MKWFHHYVSTRKTEAIQMLICDPSFGLKCYALYFLILEILYERIETYTKRDHVSMTVTQWCAELYTKWKVLKRFLEQYSEKLDLSWELKENPAPLASKRFSNNILIIKSPKALSGLESHMFKNSKNVKNYKNSENFKDVKNSNFASKYANVKIWGAEDE